MRASDLALWNSPGRDGCGGRRRLGVLGTMVSSHVNLELVRISARGRFPARDLLGVIEVVREVFGVGVADFPIGREASFERI